MSGTERSGDARSILFGGPVPDDSARALPAVLEEQRRRHARMLADLNDRLNGRSTAPAPNRRQRRRRS